MTRFFWKRFIGAWIIAFLSLQLSRLVFYLNLRSNFHADFTDIVGSFLFGFEFDAVSIAYLLGLFFIALPFLRNGIATSIAKWYFLIMLGAMNFLNCADAEFFKFTSRRSTEDLFEFAFLSNDIVNIAPNLIGTFWYLLVAFLLIMLLSWFLLGKLLDPIVSGGGYKTMIGGFPVTAVVLVISARGGLHPIPLSIIDASKSNQPHLNSLILSTPFTILKTLGKPELPDFDFPEIEEGALSPIQTLSGSEYSSRLKGSNVVLIIVESLGCEYIQSMNGLNVGYAPFVDSIIGQSLVFDNAFANGHRSIEGIAAVAASIPTLMYEPFTTSRYAGNKFTSLASILRQEGYYTTFMHGGNKNSMNFESFASQAGYNLFYDRDDYPLSDEHYDGVWGIADHYMLNHCVEKYTEYKKPFFSTIFTLSSHHPYTIPKAYQNRFPKGTLPIHESLGYADQALREFFAAAAKTDWYKNTLFIITADHTSLSEHPKFQSKLGSLRIPIILFHPTDTLLRGRAEQVVQQSDIMPTVLDLLGYDRPYFSFGVSAFAEQQDHVSVAFKHDQYQLFRNDQLICFDGEKTNFVYSVKTDELLQDNLLTNTNVEFKSNEAFLKSYLRNYATALNQNRMTYDLWKKE